MENSIVFHRRLAKPWRNAWFTIAFLSCLSVPQGASAQEVSNSQSGSIDWSGVYMGGYIGVTRLDDRELTVFPALPQIVPSKSFIQNLNDDGIVGGVLGGFNYQSNNAVFGIEADLGLVHGVRFFDMPVTFTEPAIPGTRLNLTSHVRGRVGYAWDKFMVFAAAGLAVADYKSADNNVVLFGYSLGSGFEFALSEGIKFRAEYLFDDYGRKKVSDQAVTFLSTGQFGPAVVRLDPRRTVDVETHTLRAVISFDLN